MIANMDELDITELERGRFLAGGNGAAIHQGEGDRRMQTCTCLQAVARFLGVGAACATAVMQRRTWTEIGLQHQQ
jgi:hypothetical protein